MGELYLYSKDRLPGGTSSSFVVRPYDPITTSKFSMYSAFFPVPLYNVDSRNNVLDFNDGVVKSVTITPGAYSIGSLVAAIETGLNNASTNFTVTFDSTTLFVTIARSAGTVNLLFGTGTNVASSIASTIGFAEADTGVGPSFTGGYAPDLVTPATILVQIQEPGFAGVTTAGLRYTFSVPITSDIPGTIFYEPVEPECITLEAPRAFHQFTVALFDDQSRPLNLHGAEWNMRLRY